ncbi:MAG: hypothetical protein L6R36_000572 [Xanthoria steineri]|nr:MAG: hypothetical protein L6R36_000572 [Xanthoria steineri]
MRLRIPSNSIASIKFQPNVHVPSYPVDSIIKDFTHILRPQTAARFESHPKRGLWIRVLANGFGGKATVRRWVRRRVREAVRQEFKTRGMSFDGMAVENIGGKELKGTMELFVKKEAVAAEWSNVRAQLGKVVEALVAMAEEGRKRGSIRGRHGMFQKGRRVQDTGLL